MINIVLTLNCENENNIDELILEGRKMLQRIERKAKEKVDYTVVINNFNNKRIISKKRPCM